MITRSGNVKTSAEEKSQNTDGTDAKAIQNLKKNEKYIANQSYKAKEESEILSEESDDLTLTSKTENSRTMKTGSVSSSFNHPQSAKGVIMLPFAVVAVAVGFFAVLYVYYNVPLSIYLEKPFCNVTCEVNQLENRFKGQPMDLWITLESCLQPAMQGNRPCIITLLNGGDSNEQTCLHREIGGAARRLFNMSENSFIHHYGSDMKKNGFSFNDCKSQLKEQKIMLVSEMENIPGEELNKFHSLCDVHDAAVKKAVIIFMLNFKDIKVDLSPNSNDNTLAVKLMQTHLKHSLHHDLIDPLVIRITENVVKLNFGNPIKC